MLSDRNQGESVQRLRQFLRDGRKQIWKGKIDKGKDLFDEGRKFALAHGLNNAATVFEASSLIANEEYDKAISILLPITRLAFELQGDALDRLGWAYWKIKDYDNAIQCYENAIKAPGLDSLADTLNNLGNAYAATNDYDIAIQYYEKALHSPEFDSPGYAWNNMGNAYAGLNKYKDAIRCYKKALRISEFDSPGYSYLGLSSVFYKSHKRKLAISYLTKAKQAALKDPSLLERIHFLGLLYQEELEASKSGHKALAGELASLAKATAEPGKHISLNLTSILDKVRTKKGDAYSKYATIRSSEHDDCLIMLKGWSSAIPLLSIADPEAFQGRICRGGGYFLKTSGFGIVIDPGFDFLLNFSRIGLHIREVGAVFVTHNHPDHQDDLIRLSNLNMEFRKRLPERGRPPAILYYLDSDTIGRYKHILQQYDIDLTLVNTIEAQDNKRFGKTEVQIFATEHIDKQTVYKPVGCVFNVTLRNGDIRRIGYTSDTGYRDELLRDLTGCDILICHFGSARENDLLGKEQGRTHLGLMGLKKLIAGTNAGLYIISEFWGGVGDFRFDLIAELKKEFSERGRKDLHVLASDIGLTIDLSRLAICCSRCAQTVAYSNIMMTRPAEFGPMSYLCGACLI